MSRDESQAIDELRKLLITLGGPGVTPELATSIRQSAENISRRVHGSGEVAELYDKILRATQPALSPEPASCRALREQLNRSGDVTTRTIIAALAASGFSGRRQIPLREEECFRNIIHASLQSLRARLESIEDDPPARLQLRISSLREVLDALPPDILPPRQLVEKIIRQLEIGAARDIFDDVLNRLRRRVAEQDTDADALKAEAKSNHWALANPAAPEVKEAQQHFARLEELQRAYANMLADAERVRLLAEEQHDYDQALSEVQMAEARLRQTGLLKRDALDEAIALLVDRLAEEYEWEERAAADPTQTEAALEVGLSNLQRLSIRLQKVPAAGGSIADSLRQKCAALMGQRALLLNSTRMLAARKRLRSTSVEAVPAYIEELRASELLTLHEWAWEVQRVWDSLQYVREAGAAPVEETHLDRLERAEQDLGTSPLAESALAAVRAYRLKAAREYLSESSALVKAIEDAGVRISNNTALFPLSDAITAAVQSILSYRRMQDEASTVCAEAQRQFPSECIALDQRVRVVRQSRLPAAVNRWADLAVATMRSETDIMAARRSLATWREVLDTDFPHDDILRRFDERSAELQIQALEVDGKFDEALRLLEVKREFLSDGFLLALEQRLRRRRAARDYEPGREGEIVAVIGRYGADSDLLRKLIDDFRTNGACQHLAHLHGSLAEIESVDRKAARLVSWSYDFQSDSLDALAEILATSEAPESVALFAKAIAAGDRYVAALRVLGKALKLAGCWPPSTRKHVEASHKIADDKFTAACREIARGLKALQERCDSDRPTGQPGPSKTDAELIQQLEVAFVGARNFLSAAIQEVAGWRDFLSTANRLGVACDPTLLGGVQELDHRLLANRQLLTELAAARREVLEKGWEKLPELENTLNVGAFTGKIAEVAAVTQLLHEYLKNYRPTIQSVGQLVEAWHNGGDGLTRAEVMRLVERLTKETELKYDFRPGHDRFRQLTRFGGKSFAEFVRELESMTAEIQAVASYEAQLNNLLVGEKEPLRLRLQQGSETNRQEIGKLLRQLDAKGASLLELFKNPPRVAKSPVAVARLRALQDTSWFDLLRRAVSLAEDPKDKGVVHDRA